MLRAAVRERLRWVSWRDAGRGLFEIDGVPDGVLRHFSQRRAEIEERAGELVGVGAELSREAMQGIALATRRAKEYSVDGACWRERAQARAAEHGFGRVELDALHGRRPTHGRPDLQPVFSRLSGPQGLTEMHNTFAPRHVLAEIAGAFGQGASAAELELATSNYLAEDTVRSLSPGRDATARYTTVGLLAREREIVNGAERRIPERTGVLPSALVARVLSRSEPALNADQAAAVRALTSSGRGIDVVEALAGTGKTTMIGALADCYRSAGWRVIGAAPTGRAARQLREVAEIPAGTMHALLGELDRSRTFAARTVLVLDEAGMAPTRLTARLFAHAERAGIKVIAVGDPGQLGSVQAGGWLAALARQQPTPRLREVMRQRDASERDALEALRDGEAERYLAHKQDAINVHATEFEALQALVEQWHVAQREHSLADAVMIARDNATRERLNRAARARLKQDGVLSTEGVVLGGREFAAGDRVITRRNDRQLDVDNGTLGTVVSVSPREGVRIEADSGQVHVLDRLYAVAHLEHAYAITGHSSQSSTVTWAGVIGRPAEFSREWAYTAASRARDRTLIHVISEPSNREHERGDYAPDGPGRERTETLRALQAAMTRSETERLAIEHAPRGDEQRRRLADAARMRELERIAELDMRYSLASPAPRPLQGPASRWRTDRGPERGRGIVR